MDLKLNKGMKAVAPSAALACAAWLLLHLLEQRHAAAHTRYRTMIDACRQGPAGKGRELIGIAMMAPLLLLLSLMIGALDTVSKADWLKLFGAPSLMLGLLLAIPAVVLLIMHGMLINSPLGARPADPRELHRQPHAGAQGRIPERRRRERGSSARLQARGA